MRSDAALYVDSGNYADIIRVLKTTPSLAESVPIVLFNCFDEATWPPVAYTEVLLDILPLCKGVYHLFIRTLDLVNASCTQLTRIIVSCTAFTGLTTLVLGHGSGLRPGPFFVLLAQLPSLRKLEMTSRAVTDGPSAPEPITPALAQPACSLTHLSVRYEFGLAPEHFPLLLSRSTNTLQHLELRHVFCDEVCIAEMGLARCVRLRHLAVDHNISMTGVLAAVPRVQWLTLGRLPAPGHNLLALLSAPLRILELETHNWPSEPLIVDWCLRLQELLPSMPSLVVIRFVITNWDENLVAEPEAFVAFRRVCTERRIRLSVMQRAEGSDYMCPFLFTL
ncbi:hypothetical protein AURDEDRAFT_126899 [Auricularia subglabra TFB-10046 SS5]|nr:hypothetical protein AURDEDRAFT_126899 [Auricularia subglabra TFB-10046 SS5]